MNRKCVSCGGGDFIDGVKLLDRNENFNGEARLCIEGDPSAFIFKEAHYSKMNVLVCEDCGFVHQFAVDLLELKKGSECRAESSEEWQRREIEGMGEWAQTCRNCKTVHDKRDCPKCGFSSIEEKV